MKQVLIQHGQILLVNVPAPIVEAGHLLVEVGYSLISSGTELASLEGSGKSLFQRALAQPEKVKQVISLLKQQGVQKTVTKVQGKVNAPAAVGYSCSGIVLQVGKGIQDIHIGDEVACAGAGKANHAEVVCVPRNLVVPIPGKCSLKDASSVTLGAIAMQGFRRADPRLGEIVAVIGLGLLGQITVQLLKAAGCKVIGVDLNHRRLELAHQLGADYVFSSNQTDIQGEVKFLTGDKGVDATIITAASTSNALIQQAMEITRKKGRVVIVGAVGLGLSRSPFYEKEIDLLISCSYGPGRYDLRYEEEGLDYPYAYVRWTENRNMAEYLSLISQGKMLLDKILEREYEFDQASQAYLELREGEEKPLGVVLRYKNSEQADKLNTKIAMHSLSPGKKISTINVAVVGAGNFARAMHLPNLQKLSGLYHIRAIVDKDGVQARTAAEQFNSDYSSTSYEDVLSDPDVDMVMLTTRHNLHAEQAMKAARARKAIFVEKPMALNLEELCQLETILRETGVPYLVGFNRRFSPAARRLKKIISNHQSPLMILYRVNAGYLPLDHWTQSREGGGRIIGEACHMFDLFQFLVEPARVTSILPCAALPKIESVSSSDNISTTIQYSDGSVATLLYTSLGAPSLKKEYMEVYTDGKTFILDDYINLEIHGVKARGWKSQVQDKGHLEELKSFAAYIQGKSDPPISLESIVDTTKVSFTAAGIR